MQTKQNEGLRFNQGKLRYDLLPPLAINELARVMTKGAEKYADHNWRKGMDWSKVIASLKRHMSKIELGEDYDQETGCLHAAHIMANAGILTEYYSIFPQGDDRPHNYLNHVKIGLDIDEVCADFMGAWIAHHGGTMSHPEHWNFDRDIVAKFENIKDDKEFWMNIKVKTSPKDIGFEPHCYITSRIIPVEWTEEWLDANGFPSAPVYSLGHEQSKTLVAKQSSIDIFVDDKYENFVELNNNGVCCYLFDAPHNRRYSVGHKRIYSLKELTERTMVGPIVQPENKIVLNGIPIAFKQANKDKVQPKNELDLCAATFKKMFDRGDTDLSPEAVANEMLSVFESYKKNQQT